QYGASVPHQWHRGWPGMGFTHSVAFGLVAATITWIWRRNRAVTVGVAIGCVVHVLADVGDTAGVMVLFPFSTTSFTLRLWAYGATAGGGKFLDAAAYYSSLGLIADLVWLLGLLVSWRALTRQRWLTEVVPAEPRLWARLSRTMPEPALLALYRGLFFFGLCRMIAWALWAHLLARPVIEGKTRFGYPFDLTRVSPRWMTPRSLDPIDTWLVPPVSAAVLVGVYALAIVLWEPMGRAQTRRQARSRRRRGIPDREVAHG
ncbi:MAG TPA: metal-dependent hydrolase, partial [Acidimicrobiales bacterium]|nr:metal-dependent hydrolase [Acidimicrobiales bacterium]